jgi:hypothetical protein
VVKGTQLWTKSQQIPGLDPRQVTFSEEIADLVESIDHAAREENVSEQGRMRAIGSPGQVLLI